MNAATTPVLHHDLVRNSGISVILNAKPYVFLPRKHEVSKSSLKDEWFMLRHWSDSALQNSALSSTLSALRPTRPDDSALLAALHDLSEVKDEAREENYQVPSTEAISHAGRILRAIYQGHPRRFEVYPTQDGEVAIDACHPKYPRSVLILCASDGSARCLVNLDGHHRRAVYDAAETLPDAFTQEALSDVYD